MTVTVQRESLPADEPVSLLGRTVHYKLIVAAVFVSRGP